VTVTVSADCHGVGDGEEGAAGDVLRDAVLVALGAGLRVADR
jgi:hypothetical protein